MILQIDTREKPDKISHITSYLDKQGVKWVRSKCVVGDYVNLENPMVVIDRKQGLQELAGNVGQQHERFVRELVLAKDLGYSLIVLVEDATINKLEQVPSWYNWRLKANPKAMTGKQLYKILNTMSEKYGVIFMFTNKQNCAKRILELLEVQGG